MRFFALIFFLLFSVVYGLLTSAVVYHLKQYTVPGYPLPRVVLGIFFFTSLLFWLFALYFLFKIPAA